MKKKLLSLFMVFAMTVFSFMPMTSVSAGVTDGAYTNSVTTLVKTESITEEVPYDTDLKQYIASKKAEYQNALSVNNPEAQNEYLSEWLSLYVADNGVYKYPVYLSTVFTGVTTSGSEVIQVGDPNDLVNSNGASYNYEIRYREVTVVKAENPNEIKNVNINLIAPIVGNQVLPQGYTGLDTENIIDDGTMEPDSLPSATSSTNGVTVDSAYWISGTYTENPNKWDLLFFGTFKENNYYYADINISADEGYTLNDNLTIKVNGEAPAEVFAVYDGESTHFIAKIKSVKEQKTYTLEKGDFAAQFTYDKDHDFNLYMRDVLTMTPEEILSKLSLNENEFNQAKEMIINNVKKHGTLLNVYLIEINDGNEKYTGEVKVKIKLTDEMKKYNTFKLVYLDNNNNFKSGEVVNLKVEGDYLVGTLPHLSIYGLVGSNTETTTSNPHTGDNIMNYVMLFGISVIGFTGMLILKERFEKISENI